MPGMIYVNLDDAGAGDDGSDTCVLCVDAGTLTESIALAIAVGVVETNVGHDWVGEDTPITFKSVLDALHGYDSSWGVLPVGVVDEGAGSDTVSAPSWFTDTGAVTESVLVGASLSVREEGVAVEVVDAPFPIQEIGVVDDQLGLVASLTLADSGYGRDGANFLISVPLDEIAVVDDGSDTRKPVEESDGGTGVDEIVAGKAVDLTDAGTVAEGQEIAAAVTVAESLSSIDALSRLKGSLQYWRVYPPRIGD